MVATIWGDERMFKSGGEATETLTPAGLIKKWHLLLNLAGRSWTVRLSLSVYWPVLGIAAIPDLTHQRRLERGRGGRGPDGRSCVREVRKGRDP